MLADQLAAQVTSIGASAQALAASVQKLQAAEGNIPTNVTDDADVQAAISALGTVGQSLAASAASIDAVTSNLAGLAPQTPAPAPAAAGS